MKHTTLEPSSSFCAAANFFLETRMRNAHDPFNLPRQARDEPENVSFKRRRPHVFVFSQDPVVVADAVKQVRRTLL